MVIVILMFTSLLLQTNCVPVYEGEDNDGPQARYNFNHPPTVEEYNPIEYNEDSVYKPRGVKVQKRVVPQISNTQNNFARSKNFDKSTNIQTTTLKSTVTTPKQNNDANVSKKPRQRDPVVPIIESENHVYSHNGNFYYSYLGGDGTTAFETGHLKVFDDKRTGESVEGSFSYTDKDGNDFSLTYTADENGYRPVGAHLPTPPPIPPAIARALQYLATKNVVESTTKLFN